MLIFDASPASTDVKERDRLQAMVAVGAEFITYSDHESTIQKSGEFVRIEKQSSDSFPRFVLLHETSQAYDADLNDLTGSELLAIAPDAKLRKRSRLYMSEIDTENGDLPFREIGGYKTYTRIPRHHGPTNEIHPGQFNALAEANYTAQAGKRRLFPTGDGKLLLAQEIVIKGDARYFNDSVRTADEHGHTKLPGLRAARVDLVEIDPITGKAAKDPVFSFDVHSGVGFDPSHHFFSGAVRSTDPMYDASYIYAAFSGVGFGSALEIPTVSAVPVGGDAADTYAIADPARAKNAEGKEYTSIVAVYPAADDVYDSRSSGAYRLTCKRTIPGGGVALTKITFPTLPTRPKHYLAARGMSLHRLDPNTLCLRVNVHAMQFGAGGTIQAVNSDAFFVWSHNNGETWTYNPVTAGFPGVFPYGGMLVKDKDTLLAFSWFVQGSTTPVQVHRITASGTAQISTIPGAVFSDGLMAPVGSGWYMVPYVPLGFGGVVYRYKKEEGTKKRLWMQFDPYWIYKRETTQVLDYPGSRPMLLVSEDGGVTWARKFLPVPWSFRAGFVVAVDQKTLAVPVYAPRKGKGVALPVTIYVSKDGGDSWKPTSAKITLPGETWVDGQIVAGAQYWREASGQWLYEQDVGDAAIEYNRGELLPMVALRDGEGKLLPGNPARPWMNDFRIKEPDYA